MIMNKVISALMSLTHLDYQLTFSKNTHYIFYCLIGIFPSDVNLNYFGQKLFRGRTNEKIKSYEKIA